MRATRWCERRRLAREQSARLPLQPRRYHQQRPAVQQRKANCQISKSSWESGCRAGSLPLAERGAETHITKTRNCCASRAQNTKAAGRCNPDVAHTHSRVVTTIVRESDRWRATCIRGMDRTTNKGRNSGGGKTETDASSWTAHLQHRPGPGTKQKEIPVVSQASTR